MSRDNVLSFLSKAAKDEHLKAKLETTASQDEVVGVANQAGYEFSTEHVEEVITELKQKPGFFGMLSEAVAELFGPVHDDYPATGVLPYGGDSNPKP